MERLAILLVLVVALTATGCSGGGGGSASAAASGPAPGPPAPPPPGPALDFTTTPVVAAPSSALSAAALQVADLDRDGRADVGMVSGTSFYVFLAPYATSQRYPGGPGPEALAFADLDGDGDLDAVLSNSGLVTVLRNRGNGTFMAGLSVQSGDGISKAVAAADFTGDGLPDVVSASATRITLLANDGVGGLLPPVTVDTGGAVRLAALPRAGGAADLLAATDSVRLLVNDGTGTFTPGAVGAMPGDVVDLAVLGTEVVGLTSTAAQVFTLPGMAPGQTLPLDGAQAITAVDADLDGDLDLVALGLQAVTLFTRGPGGFSLAWTRAQGGAMSSVRAGDANGDGRADLALWDGSGLLGAALGTADGTFGLPRTTPLVSTPGIAIAGGNFGGSGGDLVTLQSGSANAWRNDGAGNFTAQPAVSVSAFHPDQAPSYLRVADLNRDRLLDLVTAGGASTFAQASLATSPGNFQVVSQFGNVAPGGLDVGDYDGDGHPDIALGDLMSDTLLLGQGGGDGTFSLQAAQSGSTGFGGSFLWLESGDFNGDTLLDLVAMMANGDVWGLRGQVSFDFLEDIQPVPTRGAFFRLLPLSGAELPDLFWGGSNAYGIDPSNGNSTITPFVDTPDVDYPGALDDSAVGDFDGDGLVDLAMLSNGAFGILTGNGDGTFSDPDQMPRWFAGAASGIVAGDFNRDGRLDLAAVGADSLVLLLHR